MIDKIDSHIHLINDTTCTDVNVLGGKGAGLVNMVQMGLNVPKALIIDTGVCQAYMEELDTGTTVEAVMLALQFCEEGNLYSVRSGAPVSMPGMMDTILNVGIFRHNLEVFSEKLGKRSALDCYRRFLTMFGTVALGMKMEDFTSIMDGVQRLKYGNATVPTCEADLNVKHLTVAIEAMELLYKEQGKDVPSSLAATMQECVLSVFDSWSNERAVHYRNMEGISHDMGTAVVIQKMVFGNLNDQSCSGVVFTRNPSTGENKLTGEFLPNAQGEDVVAGTHTPLNITEMMDWNPEIYDTLHNVAVKLENLQQDMQDIEFTVEDGKLYILQTRRGKRTSMAAFKIAADMLEAGQISSCDLRSLFTTRDLSGGREVFIAPEFTDLYSAVGIPAGGSVVSGAVCFTSASAVKAAKKGPVILVSKETTPDDLAGMEASSGILTSTGGFTSHAAVVARGLGRTCVTGVTSLTLLEGKEAVLGDQKLVEGDMISIDGLTGKVWACEVATLENANNYERDKVLALLRAYSDGVQYVYGDRIEETTIVCNKIVIGTGHLRADDNLVQKLSEYVSHFSTMKGPGPQIAFDFSTPVTSKGAQLLEGLGGITPYASPAQKKDAAGQVYIPTMMKLDVSGEAFTLSHLLEGGVSASEELAKELGQEVLGKINILLEGNGLKVSGYTSVASAKTLASGEV